ncbi:MAG: transposase, partial [Holosporaceae bacterium]|nr:transposase [Holosporaceae bacterium]
MANFLKFHGFSPKKPQANPKKVDLAAQKRFIKEYKKLYQISLQIIQNMLCIACKSRMSFGYQTWDLVLLSCKECGISDHTYYKWRREYGGLDVSQAKELKRLKEE